MFFAFEDGVKCASGLRFGAHQVFQGEAGVIDGLLQAREAGLRAADTRKIAYYRRAFRRREDLRLLARNYAADHCAHGVGSLVVLGDDY